MAPHGTDDAAPGSQVADAQRPEAQPGAPGVIAARDRVPDPGQRGSASGGSGMTDPAGSRLAGIASPSTPGGTTGQANAAPGVGTTDDKAD